MATFEGSQNANTKQRQKGRQDDKLRFLSSWRGANTTNSLNVVLAFFRFGGAPERQHDKVIICRIGAPPTRQQAYFVVLAPFLSLFRSGALLRAPERQYDKANAPERQF